MGNCTLTPGSVGTIWRHISERARDQLDAFLAEREREEKKAERKKKAR